MEKRENSAKEKVEKIATEPNLEEQHELQRENIAKQKRAKQQSKKKAKANAKKVADTKKRNKEKAQKERKALKEEKRREHKEKRDLAHKQRQEKLEMFKAEKLKLKQEKALQKQETRKIKLENKARAKADKRAKREERSKRRSNRGVGGWIAAVVSLGLVSLILASLLTVNYFGGVKNFPQMQMGYSVTQSYDEFVEYNQSIDTNLAKFFVSNGKKEQQKLLMKITEDSLLAEENLQRLPLSQMRKHSTTKVINQIGDYAKYLNNKLIDGLSITKEERENLYTLYGYNKSIKEGLVKISDGMASGEKMRNLFKENGLADQVFKDLEDMAVVYPQLIYDGPFSDGLNAKKVKGLSGEEISKSQAEKIFKSLFTSYNLNMHEITGELNANIKCYTAMAKDENGNEVYAEISKVGGKLIMFDYFKECPTSQEKLSREECETIGLKFLKNLGINNMSAVWFEESQEEVTINYACKEQGVIIYPDLIKLNVCKNQGKVFGMEATNYYLNHTNRDIQTAKISKDKAVKSISSSLDVQSVRLAIIPKGNSSEVLTYEVYGECEDGKYFVYVNAENGEEEQIFKVVTTSQGELLI